MGRPSPRVHNEEHKVTVIAGYTDGHTWAIGADSGIFEGGDYEEANDSGIYWETDTLKIWRREDSLIGYSGMGSAGAAAQSCKSGDPYKIAEAMKAAEVTGKSWNLLVVRKEAVYYLDEDGVVFKMRRGYMTIGGAGQVALGALMTAKALGIGPIEAVKLAVKASIDHHVYARGPVKSEEH